MPEPNNSNSLQLLDQLSSVCSDFLISHPLTNLKYQCQANTTAHNKHINPLSAVKLFFSQLNTHGILPLYLKGLQPHCAYITIEGILKKVMIELVSEVSGVDLNLLKSSSSSSDPSTGSPNPTSVSEIKYSITSYILKFFAETLKTIGLTTFYSSNLLLKINSLIASDQDQKLDYSMLLDFFRVSWNRVFTDTSLTEGYHSSSFSFGKLILPTILSVGLESALYSVLRPFVAFVFRLIVEGDNQSKRDGSRSGKNVEEESSRVDQFIEVYDRRKFYHERYIDLITAFLTKLLIYKFETVSTKMHVQGTRLLVDDTDLGYGVKPIARTHYTGFINTWRNVYYTSQGYNGFGFVIVDFAVKLLISGLVSQIGDSS